MQIWILSVLAFFIFILVWRVLVLERKFRILFGGSAPKTEAQVLHDHSLDLADLKKETVQLRKHIEDLEHESKFAIKKVGMVRFKSFSDSGGDQSFAIALLNADNNGFVISSLYFQGHPMVYAKPIESGISKYALSDEERAALEKAASR